MNKNLGIGLILVIDVALLIFPFFMPWNKYEVLIFLIIFWLPFTQYLHKLMEKYLGVIRP